MTSLSNLTLSLLMLNIGVNLLNKGTNLKESLVKDVVSQITIIIVIKCKGKLTLKGLAQILHQATFMIELLIPLI
jgi:hypothetical protein